MYHYFAKYELHSFFRQLSCGTCACKFDHRTPLHKTPSFSACHPALLYQNTDCCTRKGLYSEEPAWTRTPGGGYWPASAPPRVLTPLHFWKKMQSQGRYSPLSTSKNYTHGSTSQKWILFHLSEQQYLQSTAKSNAPEKCNVLSLFTVSNNCELLRSDND